MLRLGFDPKSSALHIGDKSAGLVTTKIKSNKTVAIPTMSQLSATAAFLRESRRSIEPATTSRCPA
ncbi:hypothetical protein ALC60_01996 [Trachymyrmex zeteki]|uniref:Uncharacterized protein n=1 Tax=Mycetomoellerius zeteki TaxID=64791 RepID=A0A151XF37_9HYME|nr:hypothetical protein ALC60_01996 [Trachymyrmex zeteki]